MATSAAQMQRPPAPAPRRAPKGREALYQAIADTNIAFNPMLVRICGDLNAGILLSQLLYWTPRTHNVGGWIHKTQAEIQQETTLTRCQQETARQHLGKLKVLWEKRAGLPARLFFRIDLELLEELVNKHLAAAPATPKPVRAVKDAGNQHTGRREGIKPSSKPTNKDAENPQAIGTETLDRDLSSSPPNPPGRQRGPSRKAADPAGGKAEPSNPQTQKPAAKDAEPVPSARPRIARYLAEQKASLDETDFVFGQLDLRAPEAAPIRKPEGWARGVLHKFREQTAKATQYQLQLEETERQENLCSHQVAFETCETCSKPLDDKTISGIRKCIAGLKNGGRSERIEKAFEP